MDVAWYGVCVCVCFVKEAEKEERRRLYLRHTGKLIKLGRFIKLRFGMQRNYSSEKIIKLI
jgi:hypothetical protein